MRAAQRGLTLVELMVSAAIALFGIACGLELLVAHVATTRRLLLQARVHQDLRAAADLVAHDLRRAGHWQSTAWPALANPYQTVATAPGQITYAYSHDHVENHAVDSNERHGFRLSAGVLQSLEGGAGWQPLTDPGIVVVTRFEVVPLTRAIPLGHLCSPPCAGDDPDCPALRLREVELLIAGHARADAAMVREVREHVRLRNDHVAPGACP